MDGLRLIYLGDPMCSWCWGIAPELDRLSSQVALPFDVVVGGLRPGPSADRMNASTAARLADHWRHVEARSGQPFDFSILDDHTWTYDTEPACRAVVAMRRIAPDRTLDWFGTLQRAFYAEGHLLDDPHVIGELAAGFGMDAGGFVEAWASREVVKETWRDFAWARSIGVQAFPTVVLEHPGGLRAIAHGYTSAEVMYQRVEGVLPVEVGATCLLGEPC
jgi:putative protein-disulfide isomerase